MATYPIVRTDNMSGTTDPALLRTVRYHNGTDYSSAINNGTVLKLDGLIDPAADREVFKGVAPAANTVLDDIVLVATPELVYDERLRNLDDYVNAAGANLRGYHLRKNDTFSITSNGVTTAITVAVGNIVELQAGTTLKIVASATASTTKVGNVIAVETVGAKTYYVIRVN
ncbi:MAG: hypothetical protein LBD92_07330 [Oscillospiraceae bacterium]|jgi:hypothetical protein|nr:hypothetical protein [Oscillospiraceae bacterium]